MVGRYFMEHPNADLARVILSSRSGLGYLRQAFLRWQGGRTRFDFRLTAPEQRRLGILNHSAFLWQEFASDKVVDSVRSLIEIQDPDREDGRRLLKVRVRLEQPPRASSRIDLGESSDAFGQPVARLNLVISKLEDRTAWAIQQSLAIELGAAGAGRLQLPPRQSMEAWRESVGWQHHHMGGTRMSSTPEKGVVDSDCRVHGLENLYVAGASVFPTSGQANPTINLVALTLRLSNHLLRANR
jgi:hypothetical protein